VLRTNAHVTPPQAALRYRDLLQVEILFQRTKAIMRTRPVFHTCDAAIRGHALCSFLALAMQKHLDDRLREAGLEPELPSWNFFKCLTFRMFGLARARVCSHVNGAVPVDFIGAT